MSEDTTAPHVRSFAGYILRETLRSTPRTSLHRAARPELDPDKRYLLKRYKRPDASLAKVIQHRCKLLRRVSHPCLPAILDHGRSNDFPFIARDFLRGLDLRQIIRSLASQGLTIPIEQLSALMVPVLEAIDIIHRGSTRQEHPLLTHGDLSPTHLLVDHSGKAHILGFESHRGPDFNTPALATLDISVPAATLYAHLRALHLEPADHQESLSDRRLRFAETLKPIVRRGLGLDPARAFASPGALASALRESLHFSGFSLDTQGLGNTVEALGKALRSGDKSGIFPLPLQHRRMAPGPKNNLLLTLDLGRSDDVQPPPFADEDDVTLSQVRAPKNRTKKNLQIPAPIDFGAPVDDKRSQPLPPFEVNAGTPNLRKEQAEVIGSLFSEILDPFDERSAEFELQGRTPTSSPFDPSQTDLHNLGAFGPQGNRRIGNVLTELGYVTSADIRQALHTQGRDQRLGEHLLRQGLINEAQLIEALGLLYDLRVLSPTEVQQLQPDPQILQTLPKSFVTTHRVLPLKIDHERSSAKVLIVDPSQHQLLTETRVLLEVEHLEPLLASRAAVDPLIQRCYPKGTGVEISSIKASLLLIDGDAQRRQTLDNKLRAERFAVRALADCAQGLQDLPNPPPAALVICGSPSAAAIALLRAFRQQASHPDAYAAWVVSDIAQALQMAGDLDADIVPAPVRPDYLVAKIRASLKKTLIFEQHIDPGMSGRLSDLNIMELVQILRLGQKNAAISLTGPWGQGQISTLTGQVVFAQRSAHDSQLQGDEAFIAMALEDQGEFRIDYDPAQPPLRNILKSTDGLLIEAARRSWFGQDG